MSNEKKAEAKLHTQREEMEKLQAFWKSHHEVKKWDGSTFIDLTPECDCVPCTNGRGMIKHLQGLAQQMKDRCDLLSKREAVAKKHFEHIAGLVCTTVTERHMQTVAKKGLEDLSTISEMKS